MTFKPRHEPLTAGKTTLKETRAATSWRLPMQFDDSAPRHLRHPSHFFTVEPKEARRAN